MKFNYDAIWLGVTIGAVVLFAVVCGICVVADYCKGHESCSPCESAEADRPENDPDER